jgi:hypothetical protein
VGVIPGGRNSRWSVFYAFLYACDFTFRWSDAFNKSITIITNNCVFVILREPYNVGPWCNFYPLGGSKIANVLLSYIYENLQKKNGAFL